MIVKKEGRLVLLFGEKQHDLYVWGELDPSHSPPPSLHGELYFCIVSGFFFITGMQNMPKACSSHCHLYGIKTSHFILMLSQEDRVHSQFRKEWRIYRVRRTARNCLRCRLTTAQH